MMLTRFLKQHTGPLTRDLVQEPGNFGLGKIPSRLKPSSTFTTRLKGIQQKHGRESVASLSTGQIPCEEMAFLGCLFKFGMGFVHGDANTRQCMATAVTAYKQSFGFDAPPACYADFEESDVIVLIGSPLAPAELQGLRGCDPHAEGLADISTACPNPPTFGGGQLLFVRYRRFDSGKKLRMS